MKYTRADGAGDEVDLVTKRGYNVLSMLSNNSAREDWTTTAPASRS